MLLRELQGASLISSLLDRLLQDSSMLNSPLNNATAAAWLPLDTSWLARLTFDPSTPCATAAFARHGEPDMSAPFNLTVSEAKRRFGAALEASSCSAVSLLSPKSEPDEKSLDPPDNLLQARFFRDVLHMRSEREATMLPSKSATAAAAPRQTCTSCKVNSEFERLFGFTQEELLDASPMHAFLSMQLIAPDDWQRYLLPNLSVLIGLQSSIQMAVTVRTKWDTMTP